MRSRIKSRELRQTPLCARRHPAVVTCLAWSGGIVADWYTPLAAWHWMLLGLAVTAGASTCYALRRPALTSMFLLASIGLTGAAAHHWQWSIVRASDLQAYATDQPRPVQLRVRVREFPTLARVDEEQKRSALPPTDRTILTVEPLRLRGDQHGQDLEVGGLCRLEIQGLMPELVPDMELEIWGTLQRPGVSRNPGGFDFRLYLREQGIHSVVRVEFPDAIRVYQTPGRAWWPQPGWWQNYVAGQLRQHLNVENGALAVALLLGPRVGISRELKDAFLNSGTVHFLAISGINVGILVALLWPVARLLPVANRLRMLLVLFGVLGYVSLTELDPPVTRAAVLVCSMFAALLGGRMTSSINQLALAALLILVWHPHDLFHTGAQLSFLAILALHWKFRRDGSLERPERNVDDLIEPVWWRTAASTIRKGLAGPFWTTCVVWLFTTPLILSRFHLVSPVGFVLNLGISGLAAAAVAIGYVCLLCALVCPWLLPFPAWLLGMLLSLFTLIVRYAGNVPWGHFQLSGPPDLWLAVFYSLLIALASGLLQPSWQVWGRRTLALWCVGGMMWAVWPVAPVGLRCTFLAVGHGAAILIELPQGETLLYDAGALEDARRARLTIESALIARGKPRIDALFISHADVDHFNAVPGLLRNIPVRQLLIHPSFLRFAPEGVIEVCSAALESRVPVHYIWEGDRIQAGSDVQMQILHPAARKWSADDNANSIVLSLRYRGRKILLTGDLEKSGLNDLLGTPPQAHDVVLAPHHGSLPANPADLARWTAPRWVVVSGGEASSGDKLQERYGPGVTLLSTAQLGAVTVVITPQGEIEVTSQLLPHP